MKETLLNVLLFSAILNCHAQSQQEREEKIRSEIHTEFIHYKQKCNLIIDAITDFNGKKEFWSTCDLKDGYRIIKIESHKNDTFYQEIYFEKDGQLIYAKETENYIPINHFTQMTWNCEFYAKDGELLSLMSLGHGKTEDEEWNPEVIFEMFETRKSQLIKIEK